MESFNPYNTVTTLYTPIIFLYVIHTLCLSRILDDTKEKNQLFHGVREYVDDVIERAQVEPGAPYTVMNELALKTVGGHLKSVLVELETFLDEAEETEDDYMECWGKYHSKNYVIINGLGELFQAVNAYWEVLCVVLRLDDYNLKLGMVTSANVLLVTQKATAVLASLERLSFTITVTQYPDNYLPPSDK